jgi:hypothetical protein
MVAEAEKYKAEDDANKNRTPRTDLPRTTVTASSSIILREVKDKIPQAEYKSRL